MRAAWTWGLSLGAVGIFWLGGANTALACAACAVTPDRSRDAYEYTCVILGAVPLASVGALFWWLKKQYREPDAS